MMLEPDMSAPDMRVAPDMALEPDQAPPLPPAGWIELGLNPSRAFYTREDTPIISAVVYDRYGRVVPDAVAQLEVTGSLGEVRVNEPEGAPPTLYFEREGEGALEACAGLNVGEGVVGERVCVRRALIVDDAPPEVSVLWPPRGAQLSRFDAPPFELSAPPPDDSGSWLPVVAQINDGQRRPIVRLNGNVVTPNEEGLLEVYLPAEVGYQRVELSVDDGVRFEEASDARWVLWADEYAPFDEGYTALQEGAMFSLNQGFLDADSPIDLSADPLVSSELAQLIEGLLGLIDPLSLLPLQTLSDTESLRLSVSELSLGAPSAEVSFSSDGLSLYLELNGVTLTTEGYIDLGGTRPSLSGEITLNIATYADFELGTNPPRDALTLTSRGSGLTITSLEADLLSDSAEALITALSSQARSLIEGTVEEALNVVINDELPPLLEESVNSLFATVEELPIDLNANLEGVPPLSLTLSISPSNLEVSRNRSAALWCDMQVTHDQPPLGPGEGVEQRGVPLQHSLHPPELPSAFTLHLQLSALNLLLAEIWRGGLLSLTPPLPPETSALVSEAQLTALSPPLLVSAERGEPYPLYLELGALQLTLSGPLAPETDEYEVFARVGATLVVEGGGFTIALEEEPTVQVRLVTQRNPRPVLSTLILERVIASTVWPQLSAGITGQLRIGLDRAPLDARALNQLGLSVSEAAVVPSFSPDVLARDGWLSLQGQLEFILER
jgi:hypothetical protein